MHLGIEFNFEQAFWGGVAQVFGTCGAYSYKTAGPKSSSLCSLSEPFYQIAANQSIDCIILQPDRNVNYG